MHYKRNTKPLTRIAALLLSVCLVLSNFGILSHASEGTGASLETIVGWSYTADPGLSTDDFAAGSTVGTGALTLVGGPAYTGYSSKSLASNKWAEGAGWQMTVDATGYKNLTFSADMRSSKTGPKNFVLKYSVDGASWAEVPGGTAAIASTSLSTIYSAVSLPELLDGISFLLKVEMVGTESLNGGTVAETGVSNINNIVISGVKISETGGELRALKRHRPVR